MSTLNAPKTISKRQELRKDQVVTVYARAWEFYEENRTLVYGIAAGLVVVLLLIAGYAWMQNNKQATAQIELGAILPVYEEANYEAALEGTETAAGLLTVADEYGSTDAGNLAHYYAADALFRLERYDEALEHFQAFDKGDNLVSASALAGEAAIYEANGEFDRAGDYYIRAAEQFDSDITAPDYLLRAGQAYEQAGSYNDAQDAYETIRDDFPDSGAAGTIDFYLARVAAATNAG
jgi:tetratricopeptide (TPR) repeat protein